MNLGAAMMVMADWRCAIGIPIGVGIRGLFRRYMDVHDVMIVIRLDQGHGGPVGGVGDDVLRLRQPMQVHGRQQGDTQTDAEVAKGARQIEAPDAPLPYGARVGNGRRTSRARGGIGAAKPSARGPPDGARQRGRPSQQVFGVAPGKGSSSVRCAPGL